MTTIIPGTLGTLRRILDRIGLPEAVTTAKLPTLITQAGRGGALRIPSDLNLGTAPIANTTGAQLTGPGLMIYTPSGALGNRVQNPEAKNRPGWGSEYLYQFLVKFAAGSACTLRMSGDSTTDYGYSDALLQLLSPYTHLTATKAGFSGEHTGQWLATRLAGDITAAADVLVWGWGMNDCTGLGRTLDQFEADLRAGLTSYRASIPITAGGILLMTPNACSDGTNGRDELRNEKMRAIVRRAAIDFGCAYFDRYQSFQDAYIGVNSWIDAAKVHPNAAFSRAIAGELLDTLIPQGIREFFVGGGVSNLGNANAVALATGIPTAYPRGISIRRALGANGWPNDGYVVTTAAIDGNAPIQINWPYQGSAAPIVRTWDQSGGVWNNWLSLGGIPNTAAQPNATDAPGTYPLGFSIFRALNASGWPLDGYVMTVVPANGTNAYQWNWQFANTLAPRVRTYVSGTWGAWSSVTGSVDTDYQLITMTSGGTTTLNRHRTLLNGSGTIAAYTVELPAAPVDGEERIFISMRPITALTMTSADGKTIVAPQTSMSIRTRQSMIYVDSANTWFPA